MKLPDHYPRELRLLAETGYQARSGNVARIELAAQGKRGQSARVVCWRTEPSDDDKQEFEEQVKTLRLVRGPDVGNPMMASKMSDFLKD